MKTPAALRERREEAVARILARAAVALVLLAVAIALLTGRHL